MRPGVIYPNVLDGCSDFRRGSEAYEAKKAETLRARALADLVTSVRGTHRQKTLSYFHGHASLTDGALLWGDRGQRRAAQRAKSLKARGYEAVP